MIFSLGVYEKAMPDNLSWEEKFKATKETGFDRIEISIDESNYRLGRLDNFDFKKFITLQQEYGVIVTTMCLSGHRKYPLGSHDIVVRNKGMDIMEKAIRFSSKSGIRIIQLAGYDVYYDEVSTKESKQYFVENLFKAANYAAKYGVILAFETMETEFMNTVEKALEYVLHVSSPYLQIYPDIGNVTNGTEDALADIKTGKGHIVAAHLKETIPGVFRNMRFGEGRVDFKTLITELKSQGVYMYTAEFWHDSKKDFKAEMKHTYDFLKPYLMEG